MRKLLAGVHPPGMRNLFFVVNLIAPQHCAALRVAGTSVELRNIKIFHREHPNLNMRHEGVVEPSWPMFESTLFRLELQKCRWSGSRPRFCDIRCTGLGLPLTDGLIARRWPAIARPNPARRGILGCFCRQAALGWWDVMGR